ncbi:MAG: hypothetical protein GY859_04970, partial [Desulfobacterales bacterium]|nr:hypothetical protein [Desulfobacterales bacterium]
MKYYQQSLFSDRNGSSEILKNYKIKVKYISDARSAQKCISRLSDQKAPFGLDTETAHIDEYMDHPGAGLDPHLSKIRLIQVYAGGEGDDVFDIYRMDMSEISQLWRFPFVAHNAVFDLKQLFHA